MKPLDLNVSIQNSYEAARVESVRIEKAPVLNRLAEETAMKEQQARAEQVNPTDNEMLREDLFYSEEYEKPDFEVKDEGEKRKKKDKKAKEDNDTLPDDAVSLEPTEEDDKKDGFSTYA